MLLKHGVVPVVGDDEHLSFDLFTGRMTVGVTDGSYSTGVIKAAVSRASLAAGLGSDGKTSSEEADERLRRGRIVATTVSGLAIALALASHAFQPGGFSAAVGVERAGAGHETPAQSIALYGIAIGCGLWFVAPKAWLAIRRLRPDMNLLMTVAILGASVIGERYEPATVAFLSALSLTLES